MLRLFKILMFTLSIIFSLIILIPVIIVAIGFPIVGLSWVLATAKNYSNEELENRLSTLKWRLRPITVTMNSEELIKEYSEFTGG